jgi:hypothetical protein
MITSVLLLMVYVQAFKNDLGFLELLSVRFGHHEEACRIRQQAGLLFVVCTTVGGL